MKTPFVGCGHMTGAYLYKGELRTKDIGRGKDCTTARPRARGVTHLL